MTQKQCIKYTERWINTDTGKITVREPYEVIDWTKSNPAGTGE